MKMFVPKAAGGEEEGRREEAGPLHEENVYVRTNGRGWRKREGEARKEERRPAPCSTKLFVPTVATKFATVCGHTGTAGT